VVVGVCRFSLGLPGNQSLKGKRRVLKSMLDRTRARFPVSIAEVADNDLWQRAVLGLAVVSNDRGHAHAMIEKVLASVDAMGLAVPLGREVEILSFGEAIGERAGGDGGDWGDEGEGSDE